MYRPGLRGLSLNRASIDSLGQLLSARGALLIAKMTTHVDMKRYAFGRR